MNFSFFSIYDHSRKCLNVYRKKMFMDVLWTRYTRFSKIFDIVTRHDCRGHNGRMCSHTGNSRLRVTRCRRRRISMNTSLVLKVYLSKDIRGH